MVQFVFGSKWRLLNANRRRKSTTLIPSLVKIITEDTITTQFHWWKEERSLLVTRWEDMSATEDQTATLHSTKRRNDSKRLDTDWEPGFSREMSLALPKNCGIQICPRVTWVISDVICLGTWWNPEFLSSKYTFPSLPRCLPSLDQKKWHWLNFFFKLRPLILVWVSSESW